MIRAANTGISAIIDGNGRIMSSLRLEETNVLGGHLPAALPPTPFSIYGQAMFWLLLTVCLATAAFSRFRKDSAL